jgi:putative transposase
VACRPCIRGAPFHPQTQGRVERWHQTLENRVLLENYFQPADACFGRAPAIIKRRERIKRQTLEYRRLQNRRLAA